MMESYWWIREIDWRMSVGVVLFFQLILWGKKERRDRYPVRLILSGLLLCGASWWMRYILEEVMEGRTAIAFGYSLYIMMMSLLFLVCYGYCYYDTENRIIYKGAIALTVYRLCWNILKLISLLPIGQNESWTRGSIFQSVLSYVLYLAVCILVYHLFQRSVQSPPEFPRHTRQIFVCILCSHMILEFAYWFFSDNQESNVLYFLTGMFYCIVNLQFLELIPRLIILRDENVSMEDFIHSKQQYYEISREGILSLQIKCHDLKHQVNRIRSAEGKRELDHYLDSLTNSIDEYNTAIVTGNQALDVVLTEKNILCSIKKIRFTYIIDGTLFSFLSDMDIYALFGNIMDNAIESMEHVECEEKKFISLRASRLDEMLVLVVENYFERELKYENGVLVTTKEEENHHGFGLRSVMLIAQQNGGNAVVQAENHIFKLTISMRIPK